MKTNWNDYYNEEAPVKKEEVNSEENKTSADPRLKRVDEVQ